MQQEVYNMQYNLKLLKILTQKSLSPVIAAITVSLTDANHVMKNVIRFNKHSKSSWNP